MECRRSWACYFKSGDIWTAQEMRETVHMSWRRAVQREGTASVETQDFIRLRSYSAAWFYRLFLYIFRYFKNSTPWAALYSLHKTFPSCCFFFTVIFGGKENDSYLQVANQEIETQRKGLMALRSLDSKRIFFFFFCLTTLLYCECLAHERCTSLD